MATRVTEVIVPLRNWLRIEAAAKPSSIDRSNSNKESFIRRTTVAYGIAELLKRTEDVSKIDEYARIDNIVLFVSKKNEARPGEDIKGIGMIWPVLTLKIEEPSYLNCFLEGEERNSDEWGRYLEVELDSNSSVLPPVNFGGQLTANHHVSSQNNNLATLAAAASAGRKKNVKTTAATYLQGYCTSCSSVSRFQTQIMMPSDILLLMEHRPQSLLKREHVKRPCYHVPKEITIGLN
jgi:hypothetical protein